MRSRGDAWDQRVDAATFIGYAAALADTGTFECMRELAAVLQRLYPHEAGMWLTGDVWGCLEGRLKNAHRRKWRGATFALH